MRCLIPVNQEIYPINSLDRAKKMCDEIILMYIVDKKLIDRVRRDSSYIIPSYALENVENFVVEIHRREAESMRESIKDVPVTLRFAVGEYYESIEKEVIRVTPDLIMCDSFLRGFLKFPVPVWIDKGNEIEIIGVYIGDVTLLKRVKNILKFVHSISEKLNAEVCFIPRDVNVEKILKEKKCTTTPDALSIQKKYYREKRSWEGTLLLI